MPCLYPMRATRRDMHRQVLGETVAVSSVALWPRGREAEDERFQIPCGKCIECRAHDRLSWALRCWLEANEHDTTTFATFTYSDDNLPPQLLLLDLQLAFKRLRRQLDRQGRKMRHFSCGEYGGETQRPHYHALLFGLHPENDRDIIEKAWGMGRTQTSHANIARIHYTVGYTTKKLGITDEDHAFEWGHWERLNRDTGEITQGRTRNYWLQPPFRVMSKRPGLGAHAKEWRDAWRTHAVLQGKTIAVPRFLKQHWMDTATEEEKAQRHYELQQRLQHRARTTGDAHATTQEAQREQDRDRTARETIQQHKNTRTRERRTLG